MAYGKKNPYDDMLQFPDWYLALGKTFAQRQQKFRSLLDHYLVTKGMKRDPKQSSGHFIGGASWVIEMTKKLRRHLPKKTTDPPTSFRGPDRSPP
jgi:hypothetical protein